MPALEASVLRRSKAIQRLCKVTGAEPFNAPRESNREAAIRSEALLFELLGAAFESILQRLDRLESTGRLAQKEN
jgi:hypothetical protein